MTTPETATVVVTQALDSGGYTVAERDLLTSLGGYQKVFDAIADATSVYAEGAGVNISVHAFIRSANRHRTRATRQDGLREARDDRKAVNGVLAGLLAPLIPNPAELIAVGNRACTEILAALSDSSTREENGADPLHDLARVAREKQAERERSNPAVYVDPNDPQFAVGSTVSPAFNAGDALREARDEIHTAIVQAYSQGAHDVHDEWQKHWESGDGYGPPDPDFTEAAHDYIANKSHFTHGAPFCLDYHEYQPPVPNSDVIGGLVEVLAWYADHMCEGWCDKDPRACNAIGPDNCAGCPARQALASIPSTEGSRS